VGEQLGPYRLESVLAETAMAVVYRATVEGEGLEVCVKTVHPSRRCEEPLIRRFQREAKVATLLSNPNTVRVLDYGVADDGTLFLVMELLSGRDLRRMLRAEGTLSVATVADIGVQICRSLEEAHRHGIVHRDLKPENVFVCADDQGHPLVRVLDYGCARLARGAEAPAGPDRELNTLTVAGTLIGTPIYMSPEQCLGLDVDRRSDLYSLGVMLFEMLQGRPPFEDELPLRLLSRHVHEPAPRLQVSEALPESLVDLVAKLLEKEPARRPARAMDVLELLLDLLEQPVRESQVELEAFGDETQLSPPPFGRFAESTLPDFEPPAHLAVADEEVWDDHTVPWTRPFTLEGVAIREAPDDYTADDPTIPERKRR